jgi:hypothetical protein
MTTRIDPPHRVVVVPALRRLGGVVLRDWLAITIGTRIYAWRTLNDVELAHELEHVRQWRRHGALFPLIYLAASVRSARAGSGWYIGNRFEAEARKAADALPRQPEER